MARLILVTKKIDSTSWNLACAMSSQYSVIVVTSQNQTPPFSQDNIQIFAALKNWTLFEVIKVVPYLFSQEEQIWHFWEPNSRGNSVSSAFFSLALLAKSMPSDRLITTLNNMSRTPRWYDSLRYFLQTSDAILAQDYENLYKTRGLLLKANRKSVVPPILGNNSISEVSLRESFELPNQAKHLVIIPQSPKAFFAQAQAFNLIGAILATGDSQLAIAQKNLNLSPRQRKKLDQQLADRSWGKQVHFIPQNVDQLLKSQKYSKNILWLAGLKFTDLELYHFLGISIETKAPLVLDTKQVENSSYIWQNGKNCWTVSKSRLVHDARQLMQSELPELPIMSEANSHSIFQNLKDRSVNEISRLYSQILYSTQNTHLK